MSVIKDMQPTARETWRESNWFDRGLLIGFEALIVAAMALRTDWVDAALAMCLTSWQWAYMRSTVELNRWHAACLNDPTPWRTRGTVEEFGDGLVYKPPTAVTVHVDGLDAAKAAQENAKQMRAMWHRGL